MEVSQTPRYLYEYTLSSCEWFTVRGWVRYWLPFSRNDHESAFGSIKLQLVVIRQVVNVYLKVLVVYWLLYGTIE